jgi:hypothetical protein
MIEDIDKYCKNKRLRKNIYRLEGIKRTDGPIDRHFKLKNSEIYAELQRNEADKMLLKKGLNMYNIYEKEFSKQQKLEDFDDY